MALTPKDYARAYYLAARGKPKAQVAAAAERLREVLRARGALRLLPQVLSALPDAIIATDADRRVTIESAAPISDATTDAILEAIGTDPKDTEVVHAVLPDLIGGVRIKRMDSVIDGSVRGRIARIKVALVN